MPATRIADLFFDFDEYDVVGQDGDTPYIRHVGLAASSGNQSTSDVPVHQMGPPLTSDEEMNADVHGTATLDDNELQKIRSFIDRHSGEHASRKIGERKSYVIHPHMNEEAEHDGTYSYTRFSCVGFAIEAYRFARIDLIDLDRIPPASMLDACSGYPDVAESLQKSDKLREWYGIDGSGPWPIIFCGYVIHALNRPAHEIRKSKYIATADDVNFPRITKS